MKEKLLKNIQNGTLKTITDCITFAIGWQKGSGKDTLPIEIIEWIYQLYYDGKID